jgi:hypothetical protein
MDDDRTWWTEHPDATAYLRLPRPGEFGGVAEARLALVRRHIDGGFHAEPVTVGHWQVGSRWLRPNRDGAVRES